MSERHEKPRGPFGILVGLCKGDRSLIFDLIVLLLAVGALCMAVWHDAIFLPAFRE